MHMWARVCVNGTEVWPFCEDRGILGTWAALSLAPSPPRRYPSFPSFPFLFTPPSFTLFAESHNEHRSLLTVHARTWKQQVNPFSPRADTPIHQFVSVSLREKSS